MTLTTDTRTNAAGILVLADQAERRLWGSPRNQGPALARRTVAVGHFDGGPQLHVRHFPAAR